MWTTNGVVQDAGPATAGSLTELGITKNGGYGFCLNDLPVSSQTGYHQLCLGANVLGGGIIAYNPFGGAAPQPFTFLLNGTSYQFPFALSGVVGPSTSIVANLACWNNTTGSLLADCGTQRAIQLTGPPYNAKCDGATDDTAAIQAWLNNLVAGAQVLLVAPSGTCVFRGTLTVPAGGGLMRSTVTGAGAYATTFLYTGASTGIDLMLVGDGYAHQYGQLALKDFRIDSSTTMAAGFALHVERMTRAMVANVQLAGQDGSNNLFGGMWCDECDTTRITGFDWKARGEHLLVNGSRTTDAYYPNQTGDVFLAGIKMAPGTLGGAGASVGIHLAGNASVSCQSGDFIGNKNNLLIDNAQTASFNSGWNFGPGCFFDSSSADNVLINDPVTNSPPGDKIGWFDSWAATCGAACFNVQSFAAGAISVSPVLISNAVTDGIKVQNANSKILVGSNVSIETNGGYGINSTVASPEIQVMNPNFVGNSSGDFNANVLTSTLPLFSGVYTWTPTVTFGGGGTGLTYSNNKGAWQLSGNTVNVEFNIQLSAKGSSTGAMLINGLPVPVNNNAGGWCGGAGGATPYYINWQSLTGVVTMEAACGQSFINIYETGATGLASTVMDSNATNTSIIYGHLNYFR